MPLFSEIMGQYSDFSQLDGQEKDTVMPQRCLGILPFPATVYLFGNFTQSVPFSSKGKDMWMEKTEKEIFPIVTLFSETKSE